MAESDATLPTISNITTASAPTQAAATTIMSGELTGRDVVLSGGYLRGGIRVDGDFTGVNADLVITLCIGLGIMENQNDTAGAFANSLLASGGPMDGIALEQNRYYLLCCVDIPLSYRAGVARSFGVGYGDADNGGQLTYRMDDAASWSFWCRVKSRRRLQGRAPALPAVVMQYQVNDIALAPSSGGIDLTMYRMDYRTTAFYPRGA